MKDIYTLEIIVKRMSVHNYTNMIKNCSIDIFNIFDISKLNSSYAKRLIL